MRAEGDGGELRLVPHLGEEAEPEDPPEHARIELRGAPGPEGGGQSVIQHRGDQDAEHHRPGAPVAPGPG